MADARTYQLAANATLFHADCRDALRVLPSDCLDSCVTDPPYALVSIVKRFGSPNAAPAKGNDAYMRASAGFMGKQWDTGETAFTAEFWAEVLRVLKPGAFVVAFGATRGYHRMTCAIEDAGFEIRDSLLDLVNPDDPIATFMDSLNDAQRDGFVRAVDHAAPGGTLAWLYGTGFPKSHDVSKGIDRALGGEREQVVRPYMLDPNHTTVSDIPATPAAREWEGWGTALKPAFEPIVLARKPLSEGTVAANVLKWRTGALNIDACRVEASGRPSRTIDPKETESNVYAGRVNGGEGFKGGSRATGTTDLGRWPANVVLTYPEDAFTINADVSDSQRAEIEAWIGANT